MVHAISKTWFCDVFFQVPPTWSFTRAVAWLRLRV